jgi:serine/threonine protein kinase
LASAAAAIHAKGYVIGDLNASNILVQPRTALVTIIDTDSFQVPNPNGQPFRCGVGKPEYLARELQGKYLPSINRAEEHDRFALAVLIFLLLMEGTHPFAGIGDPHTPEERIQNGLFPYNSNGKFSTAKPPRHAVPFEALHLELRRLFCDCFISGHYNPQSRPSALDWIKALDLAEQELVKCAKKKNHLYLATQKNCTWCEREERIPRSIHSKPSPIISTIPQYSKPRPFKKVLTLSLIISVFVFFVVIRKDFTNTSSTLNNKELPSPGSDSINIDSSEYAVPVDTSQNKHRNQEDQTNKEPKQGFNYRNFSSISKSEINLVGSAKQYNNKLRLTPSINLQAGAAWYKVKQLVESGFETTFQFQISGGSGADGFAFVIQNFRDKALGKNGGYIGYVGIKNCLAIEFDTWNNLSAFGDPKANHISVQTGIKDSKNPNRNYLLGCTTDIPKLADGEIHTVKIDYSSNAIKIFLDDTTKPVLTTSLDLKNVLKLDKGKAWVGFSGATGLCSQNHDILNWSFTSKKEESKQSLIKIMPGGNVKAKESSIKVPANKLWTKTNFKIVEGKRYLIKAKGTWKVCGHMTLENADGCRSQPSCDKYNPDCSMKKVPCAALLGKIDSEGKSFLVGKSLEFTASQNGLLFLGPNDSSWGLTDNDGLLEIEIQIQN